MLVRRLNFVTIGPLQVPVTWYGINYAGTEVTQWDIQNKGNSGWTGTSSFVLEVPLCNLRPSVINSVPCDRIVQRVYSSVNRYHSYHLLHFFALLNYAYLLSRIILHTTEW